jgi:nitrogen regulatory protein PII
MKCERNMSLIVTIVCKGWGDTVLCASREAGAEGGSIIIGRGCGIHDKKSILGITIEPEKELVLTLVPKEIEDDVLKAIVIAARLDESGKGMAFVIPTERALGRVHVLKSLEDQEE